MLLSIFKKTICGIHRKVKKKKHIKYIKIVFVSQNMVNPLCNFLKCILKTPIYTDTSQLSQWYVNPLDLICR